MEPGQEPHRRPPSFSADYPFSFIGILIAAIVGIIVGGLVAAYLL